MPKKNQNDIRGNLLSQILFLWLEPFIFRGYLRKVRFQDVPDQPTEFQGEVVKEKLKKYWKIQRKTSLFRTIITQNMMDFLRGGMYLVVANLCELCNIVMGWLILEIAINRDQNDTSMAVHGIIYCCTYTVVSIIGAICSGKYVYNSHLLDIKVFSQCIIILFEKTLSLPQDILNGISIGRIMNMVTNDIMSVEFKCYSLQNFWGFPVTFIVSIFLLYYFVGLIGLVGVGVVCINVIVMFAVTPLLGKIKSRMMSFTDKRVKFINQVINNMRVVKMFAWENIIYRHVQRIRRKEMTYGIVYSLLGRGAYILFFLIENPIAIYTTFLVSYFTDTPIELGKSVLCFLLYQQIQIITSQFILCIAACIDLYISGKRVSTLLNIDANEEPSNTAISSNEDLKHRIDIHDLTVVWSNLSKGLDIYDLKVSNEPQLIFLTGAVGAGKSTLLLTLCSEISQYQGSVKVNGSVAYSAQEAWVFSGSIRDNILVGSEFENDRYWKVLNVCGLIPDLELFSESDLTLVGERGITLSGGQKARVSLARTVYIAADIYLLDDPLAAVDSRVSRHIFEECIQGFLRDKVVILATHQTRFARDNDRIVMLENGRIVRDNKFKKAKFIKSEETISEISEVGSQKDEKISRSGTGEVDLDCMNGEEKEIGEVKPMSTALIEEELDHTRFSIYPKYFKTGGLCLTLLLLLFTTLSSITQISFIWWIQKFLWLASATNSYDNTTIQFSANLTNSTITIAPIWFIRIISKEHFMIITALIFGSALFLTQEWFTLIMMTSRAAIKLHREMLRSLINTSIRFFELHPSGRILNRFSKDVYCTDYDIPYLLLDYWVSLSTILFPLIASCIFQKFLILPSILLIIIFFACVHYYLPTATELRSLKSLKRSPLFSHIALALQGMTTIRTLGLQRKVEEDLLYHLNSYTKVWVTLQSTVAWFMQRSALIVRIFLSVVIWISFIENYYYRANENVALSFQILLNISILFSYASLLAVNLDVLMISVERMVSYIKLKPEIDSERDYASTKVNKSDTIPNTRGNLYEGNITFENVYLKYADDLPMVLKGISLEIVGGSKVGIVGRTGAGKSSIISALFRLTNISGGRIMIDKVDISHFKLNRLRTQISVIPQDPMLFTGTLRFNLDPSDQFSDSEIWSSLEHVQLRGLVASLQGGLLASVQEDGRNFSVGEKQLLCLARALLRNTRILVVDEATANVDHLTDAKIQRTLRTSFTNQTVLSIAHRLNTVIDYDRIVVMDKGEIVEVDSPHLLLQDSQSYLSNLVSQTDPATQMTLRNSAYTAYNN